MNRIGFDRIKWSSPTPDLRRKVCERDGRMRSWNLIASAMLLLGLTGCLHHSPGVLYESSFEPLSDRQIALRDQLKRDVHHLADKIGPRGAGHTLPAILAAERWIIDRLSAVGIQAQRDEVDLGGAKVANIEATFPGTKLPDEIVIVGGHYDTVAESPGANDNASGVALLLVLAERLTKNPPERTIRVVFFVNEEWPFSGGIQMGSKVYAERCKARLDHIVAMIAVDSVGCYSNERGSQDYPAMVGWFMPSKGNFIAFGSDLKNRPLLDFVVASFQKQCRFPCIGAATDSSMSARGDHAPFWWQGYPAISMSDTSEFRDPNYHRPTDTPQHLNYDDMARMVDGFVETIQTLGLAETAIP